MKSNHYVSGMHMHPDTPPKRCDPDKDRNASELCGPDDPVRFLQGIILGVLISVPLWGLIIWGCSAA
jgi:hypothetical protein